MIADAWAAADFGEPEVEKARLAQAKQHPGEMDCERYEQHPDRTKDQKQLGRDHGIGDEIGLGDARKHLRARQRNENRSALKPLHPSAAERGAGLNARDDARRTEQDEAAKNHSRPVAPVDSASQHHEADNRHGNHSDDRRDGPE